MQTIRTLLFNSAAQVIGKIITAGTGAVVVVLLARNLSLESFGGYTIMAAYVAIFYMVADFGFNAIVLRGVAGDLVKLKVEFASLLGLRLIYSLGLVFLALAGLSFFPYSTEIKLATIVTSLTIITEALYLTGNLVFQARLRYDLSVLAAVIGSIANLALIYLLTLGSFNLVSVAVVWVITDILMVAVGLGLVQTQIGKFSPTLDLKAWARLFLITFPIGLTLIFNLVYFRADTFILSFFKDTTQVGIYGAAYKIFEIAITLPAFFMNAFYPIMIRYFESDRAKFRQAIRWTVLGSAGLGAVGALFGIILAEPIINLIYGPAFHDAVLPFQILIASAPIYFLSSLYMWLMLLLKRQNLMALVYGLGMVINVALNFYFIPQYSYLAAALITGFSEALILVLTYYLSRSWKYEDRAII